MYFPIDAWALGSVYDISYVLRMRASFIDVRSHQITPHADCISTLYLINENTPCYPGFEYAASASDIRPNDWITEGPNHSTS